MIRLRRTLGGLVCYLMSSRVGLGDWHSPFWGFHSRDRRLTVVLSTLTLGLRDSWRGAAVLAGALPWGLMGTGRCGGVR
jgi:hypothetical protein